MATVKEMEKDIREIKARNSRVEKDKAWETSLTRKLTIALLTYAVVLSFFIIAKLPNPFVNALIPAFAFLISTLTLPFIKSLWLSKRN